MQIASLTPYARPLLELLAVASLCGWAACLALGLSLFTPLRAILVGLAGVAAGWAIWRFLALPPGPSISELPLAPSVAGSFLTAFVAEVVREARQTARELKGTERRPLAAPVVGLGAAPRAVLGGAPLAASGAEPAPPSESARPGSSHEPLPGRTPPLEAR